LVIEPSKSPYFVELTSFGKYTYDLVGDRSTSNNELPCPGCGSTALKRNGKLNGQQRFKCNDCGKNWA